MLSRVVPGMSDTIAFSYCKRALSSEDFPALGLPAMATGTPFFIALPRAKESSNDLRVIWILSRSFSKALNLKKVICLWFS